MTKQNLFISYSHVDQSFAAQLASLLGREGLNIWIDVEDIPSGENWRNAIDEGLKTAEIMLLIVSPESMDSAEVQAEWNYFLDEKKTVIPVLLRPADIPSRLRPIQRLDFSQPGAHFLENYARLRDRLKGAAATMSSEVGQAPFSIKAVPQTAPPVAAPAKDNGANRTQIIVAVIGTVGVIVAAVIGLLPSLVNRPADTNSANATNTVPAGGAATALSTSTPAPLPATSTPSVPVGTFATTVIFNGEDSLVVRAEAASNLTGLVLRSVKEDVTLSELFPALGQVANIIQAGQCLVFIRSGESPPPPRGCQENLEYEFPQGATFWYDNTANRARDLVLVRDGAVLGICSAGGGAGSCDFSSS